MDTYIKIAAAEGNISAQQNILNFHIPAGGVYNLRDSYIELMCHAESSSAGSVPGGIFSIGLRWTDGNPANDAQNQTHFINAAMVRNCSIDCEQKGMIESIRRCDILRQNLHTLTRSQTETYSEEYLSANSVCDVRQNAHWGLFSDLNKIGDVKSQYRDAVPIQIRLGDLMDVCNAVEFDTSLAGMTHVQVELNLDKVKAYQTFANANNIMPNADNFASTADGTALTQLTFAAGANGADQRRCVPSIADSPYYVGQIIKINGTGTGGHANVVNQNREITEIVANGTSLILTVATLGDFDNGEGLEDITVEIVDADSVDVYYDSADIVLRQVANPQGQRQIAFTTYDLEEDNGNDLTSFRKQYLCPGEATNVMVMFPSESDDLNSVNGNLTSFRLSINNEFLTDRDVAVDSPLYYNQLASTVMNMGYSLRNLQQKPGDSVQQTGDGVWGGSPVCVYVANYLQPQQSDKMLNVDLSAGGTGIKKLAIYKQLPRLLSL